jgi:uncharacterized protein (TIGR02118 family)
MMAAMVTVSVLYPKTSELHFDYEYYLTKHIPLVKARWSGMGLEQVVLLRGQSALGGGSAVWELIGLLTFSSEEKLQAAIAAHGGEIIGNVPRFSNVQPVIQINEPIAI